MKVIIIGGSHGIGKATAEAALAAGHTATVFSRRPERIGLKHQKLRLVSGSVLDAAAVGQAIRGQQAVIITLGIPTRLAIGPPLAGRSYVLSEGTHHVIAAIQKHGVRRLICETAIGAGESRRQCTPLARFAFRVVLRWLFREKDRQEELTRGTDLDWTIIRPTALSNGPATGLYDVGPKLRSGILTYVSRRDAADLMVRSLGDKATYRTALTVSYPPRRGDSWRWLKAYRP